MHRVSIPLVLLLATALALGAGPASAAPAVLDWDTNPWTAPGALSDSFSVGAGTVNVVFSGNTSMFQPGSPDTNANLDPPSNGGQQGLFLNTTANNTSPFVIATFGFTHAMGVTDIVFSFFDVDDQPPGTFTDTIFLQARLFGTSTWVAPTSVAPSPTATGQTWTLTNLTANWARIDGITSAVSTGGNSEDGVVVITFGSVGGVYDAFRFQYRNTYNPGGNQWISVSDVAFTSIPEPDTALLLGSGLLGLAALGRPRQGARPCTARSRSACRSWV